jgi:hypothetical protein
MNTQINYVDDNKTANINNINAGEITNIKFIQLHLTSDSGIDELNKSIIMKAFSCNIGTYSIVGRSL